MASIVLFITSIVGLKWKRVYLYIEKILPIKKLILSTVLVTNFSTQKILKWWKFYKKVEKTGHFSWLDIHGKISEKGLVKLFWKVIHKCYKEIEVDNAGIPLLNNFYNK
jgi:hypothetical protein